MVNRACKLGCGGSGGGEAFFEGVVLWGRGSEGCARAVCC